MREYSIRDFVFRRIHSLSGFFLVFFLIEHLITNYLASLKNENAFIKVVSNLQGIPLLKTVEIVLIALPFLVHIVLGIDNMKKAGHGIFKENKYKSLAYVFQRYSAVILIFFIFFHVLQMRFIDHPKKIVQGSKVEYVLKVDYKESLKKFMEKKNISIRKDKGNTYAVSNKKAKLILLSIRKNMIKPFFAVLYSVFVIAAAFHTFNGLRTFCITWGVTLSKRSQDFSFRCALWLTALFSLMGLVTIWRIFFNL